MRKLLFSRESECIQPIRAQVEEQLHRTLVLWALDCAEPYLAFFEANQPGESCPRNALETADGWARGRVKMPDAKRAIHAAHSAAGAVGDKTRHAASVMAAGRAIGHAAATVHVETHGLGLVLYGLTAISYSVEEGAAASAVEAELHRFSSRLLFWEKQIAQDKGPWADFLLKDKYPNKEKLLRMRLEDKARPL